MSEHTRRAIMACRRELYVYMVRPRWTILASLKRWPHRSLLSWQEDP